MFISQKILKCGCVFAIFQICCISFRILGENEAPNFFPPPLVKDRLYSLGRLLAADQIAMSFTLGCCGIFPIVCSFRLDHLRAVSEMSVEYYFSFLNVY